jgi:eukaryotic-like serine/threonine-protein kinase
MRPAEEESHVIPEATLGRYSLLGMLGRGAMGIVYEAYDPVLDRHVALKELVFPYGLGAEEYQHLVERFYNEARAAARLSHPNIVTVHDVGEDGGRFYIAMELLAGGTLGDHLAHSRLETGFADAVLWQMAEGLAAAHRQGVIHQDVKPDNCFVLPDGRVKMADFGIARIEYEPGWFPPGTVAGTPPYMSPEQARGDPTSPAADVFGWGAVGYECLTGMPPFGSDDPDAVRYRILHEEPPELAALRPDAPPHLVAALTRALEKNPRRRYRDAAAVLTDLGTGAGLRARGHVREVVPFEAPRSAGVPRLQRSPRLQEGFRPRPGRGDPRLWMDRLRPRLPVLIAILIGLALVAGAITLLVVTALHTS